MTTPLFMDFVDTHATGLAALVLMLAVLGAITLVSLVEIWRRR